MSEEAFNEEEAVEEELPEEELPEEESSENHEESRQDDFVEQRAYKMGWVPKDKFRGDPSQWRPANEFVERGEMMIPILRKQIRTMEQQQLSKNKAFEKYLADLREKIHAEKIEAHEQLKRQAVEEGDSDAYNQLSMDIPKNDLPEYKAPEHTNDPAFDEWAIENDWYKNDYEKNQEAENYGRFLRGSQPELQGRDFLDEVSKHVRKKFENPNRQKASAVDGGTQPSKGPAGKLYETLPVEAKTVFNSFVRDGIFKNTVEHREAYAKDVLS